ncbi:hypothetical protein SAOR_12040 [Salinisphaera orenii MK-B5]|uniref:Phage capsid-like C-terminal domain-containing protein n=1 Tax=Salinisphaera orenii MK-B5 TaxID=856730 RepID=A0A423PIZ1_9GAMM|nr:phage major capsid protein [Salinisphaera orenii]ROO25556.1 hypothetical protein SAOR_12040 [Salinisphaera orenii MK-B5]
MLESAKIAKRQSEIRANLAELAANEAPNEDEQRSLKDLNREYQVNESRYQAAITAEDAERRDAGADLETREGSEWDALVDQFEVRSVFANLASGENSPLSGATREVVDEMRSHGAYTGTPVPWEALEQRDATTSTTVPDPVRTQNIIDALFPGSVMGQMGARMIDIGSGAQEYPVNTSKTSIAWASTEGGNVADSTEYQTNNRVLRPDNTLGATVSITRKAQLQSAGIEDAIRRNARNAMQVEMDKAVFQGSGSNGEPLGVISGASTYGIQTTAVDAAATYAAYRKAAVEFMLANAATSVSAIRALIRPEIMDSMDAQIFDSGSGVTEFDRLMAKLGAVVLSHNALADPTGDPVASNSLLTTTAGGTQPIFVGRWGGIDVVRDVFTDAQSGGLRVTMLATMDVTVSRPEQIRILSGIQ